MKISVVIPVYNEGKPLLILHQRLIKSLTMISDHYEIILVDDRSQDNSWDVMNEIASIDKHVKLIRLIRNFGQHNALTAGIQHSSGDYIVLMDCDQQDNPEDIILLYNELIQKKINIVYALRRNRQDNFFKKINSIIVNKVFQILSGIKFDPKVGTFRIFKKIVKEAYISMPEKNRFIGGMFNWLGFEYSSIEVNHSKRQFGSSNYTLAKQLKLARLGLLSNSTKILSLGTYLGLLISFISIIFAIYNLYMKFSHNVPMGYTSIIVTISLSTGFILFFLGIIGEYLREIFEEIKARPSFYIEEMKNFDE
jgi:polyisoprenyl-phosphate glycosyltransferase